MRVKVLELRTRPEKPSLPWVPRALDIYLKSQITVTTFQLLYIFLSALTTVGTLQAASLCVPMNGSIGYTQIAAFRPHIFTGQLPATPTVRFANRPLTSDILSSQMANACNVSKAQDLEYLNFEG